MRNNFRSLSHLTRRRFVTVSAVLGGASLFSFQRPAQSVSTVTWHGIALGSPAQILLAHPNEDQARHALQDCLAEVARLEAILSLHRPESSLMRLNRDGVLENAPQDLILLLSEALRLASETDGAFDPTIQPLWTLYADHFQNPAASPEGPGLAALEDIRPYINWKAVEIEGTTVRLKKPRMALTLNGIAQGFITDKVADVLRYHGFEHVLIDMGEQIALGPKWEGTGWRIGIKDPLDDSKIVEEVSLASGAVSTSSATGFHFDAKGKFSHLLNPKTLRPQVAWASVTALSDRSTRADGLSTALSLLSEGSVRNVLRPSERVFVVPVGTASSGYWI